MCRRPRTLSLDNIMLGIDGFQMETDEIMAKKWNIMEERGWIGKDQGMSTAECGKSEMHMNEEQCDRRERKILNWEMTKSDSP